MRFLRTEHVELNRGMLAMALPRALLLADITHDLHIHSEHTNSIRPVQYPHYTMIHMTMICDHGGVCTISEY